MKSFKIHFLLFLFFSCAHHQSGKMIFSDKVQSENTNVYELDVSFPFFECVSEACSADEVNDLITQRLSPYLDKFQGVELEKKEKFLAEQKDFTEERKFTLSIHHETTQSSLFVSTVFTVELYELGAHGVQLFETLVFDRKKNKELKFQDLISGDLKVLDHLLTDILNKKDSCFDRNVFLENDFRDFSLTESELVFHFAPYQLGAYVCGSVSLGISFEQLKAHNLWAYKP